MESESKTIEISVLNLVDESRAAVVGGDTAQGTKKLCAEFGELKILFVEADGKIVHEDTLVADNENMTDDTHTSINGEYVKRTRLTKTTVHADGTTFLLQSRRLLLFAMRQLTSLRVVKARILRMMY